MGKTQSFTRGFLIFQEGPFFHFFHDFCENLTPSRAMHTFMTRQRRHQSDGTISKIMWPCSFYVHVGTFIFCGVRFHRPCKFTNLWIWETTLLIRYFRFNALARKSVALCVTLKARAFISTLHTDSYNKLISVTLFTHCRDFMCGIKTDLEY